MSLKSSSISGVIWTFAQQFSVQIINFVVQIVLARILFPSDFGLIAMLAVFIAVGNSLVDSGLTSSLIRSKEPDQGDYSTVFYFNLLGSILVYLILFFSATFIADFYNKSELINIIRVFSLTFVIRAFSQIQLTKLTKEMNFKLQMMIQVPSVLISGIIGVVLAMYDFGVWSLVYMNVIQAILSTLQLWIRSKWIPSFIFDRDKFKYHFNFGYKIALSGMLNTIFNNLYSLIIGKFFSASQLGFYNRADTLRLFPVINLSTALNKVTYPLFASIQDDDVQLKNAYKKIMQQVIFWITPLMIFLIIVAEPLFRIILTDKWLDAVPYFQLLCISSILYPIQSYNLNILNVKGRSDLFLKLEIIKKIIIVIGIIIALPFGIIGLLYFQVANSFISYFINSFYSGKLLNYSTLQQLKDISPTIILASILGVFVWFFSLYIKMYFNDIVYLSLMVIIYFLLYFLATYFLKFSALIELKKIIFKRK